MATINLTNAISTITVRQGTTLDLVFKLSIKSSTTGAVVGPIDVTDYKFRVNLGRGDLLVAYDDNHKIDTVEDSEAYGLPVNESYIEVADGAAGTVHWYMSAIETKKLVQGNWKFEIEYTTADDLHTQTYLNGDFVVEKDVK